MHVHNPRNIPCRFRFIFERSYRNIQTVCVGCDLAANSSEVNLEYFHLILESLGDCSFLNTCFHMDTCKVSCGQFGWQTIELNL